MPETAHAGASTPGRPTQAKPVTVQYTTKAGKKREKTEYDPCCQQPIFQSKYFYWLLATGDWLSKYWKYIAHCGSKSQVLSTSFWRGLHLLAQSRFMAPYVSLGLS